jgi:hypothetical protein
MAEQINVWLFCCWLVELPYFHKWSLEVYVQPLECSPGWTKRNRASTHGKLVFRKTNQDHSCENRNQSRILGRPHKTSIIYPEIPNTTMGQNLDSSYNGSTAISNNFYHRRYYNLMQFVKWRAIEAAEADKSFDPVVLAILRKEREPLRKSDLGGALYASGSISTILKLDAMEC